MNVIPWWPNELKWCTTWPFNATFEISKVAQAEGDFARRRCGLVLEIKCDLLRRGVRKLRWEVRNHHAQGPRFVCVPVRQQRRGLHIGLQLGLPCDIEEESHDVGRERLAKPPPRFHRDRIVQWQMYFFFHTFDNSHRYLLSFYQSG